ncbi:MAG: hypothetical protein JW893_02335 [Candidatus Omnitrophica bacterium]|nr:hypothetical protein [Candidatus Omnitrophota bacterium]
MDRKLLYEKTEKAINQAFEIAKQSAKVFSEKAGEAAQVTRLFIEKATLEHKLSQKFAEIGHYVYDKASEKSSDVSLKDAKIKRLVGETKRHADKLRRVETSLKKERKKKANLQ